MLKYGVSGAHLKISKLFLTSHSTSQVRLIRKFSEIHKKQPFSGPPNIKLAIRQFSLNIVDTYKPRKSDYWVQVRIKVKNFPQIWFDVFDPGVKTFDICQKLSIFRDTILSKVFEPYCRHFMDFGLSCCEYLVTPSFDWFSGAKKGP